MASDDQAALADLAERHGWTTYRDDGGWLLVHADRLRVTVVHLPGDGLPARVVSRPAIPLRRQHADQLRVELPRAWRGTMDADDIAGVIRGGWHGR